MSHRPTILLSVAAVFAATLIPTVSASADEPTTVELTGTLIQLADEPGLPTDRALLDVEGSGFLSVDVADVAASTSETETAAVVTLAVPETAEVAADDTAAEVFTELAEASSTGTPVEVVAVDEGPEVKEVVTKTPATPATHRVYGVLVSPGNGAQSTEQTAAAIQNAVSYADGFWNQQSSGSIRFTLAATAGWYSSALSCANEDGLWNEAAARVGYPNGPNDHLVLFFPDNADCGSQGLGTVGRNVNSGGLSWQLGTDDNTGKTTIAHELGHNISLGHANWLACSTAAPSPGVSGTDGCAVRNYGDGLDVQGFSMSQVTSGALSAPAAVRASIWPAEASVVAPQGTSTYTLNSVSSNSGLRSVIVDDDNGVSYFVEYRDYTDEDAQFRVFNNVCQSRQCFSAAGVRVLRLQGSGGPGADTYLIGRTVNGANRSSYTTGETFLSQGTAGVGVTVTAVNGATATVSIQRGPVVTPPASVTAGTVTVNRTGPDGTPRVGDSLSVALGSSWTATSYAYEWLRNGTAIPGATASTYVLQAADRGATVTVRVTGSAPGLTSASASGQNVGPVADPLPTGPTAVVAGTVTVNRTGPDATPRVGDTLSVTLGSTWTATSYAYQWQRNGADIAGGTTPTYVLQESDRGALVNVRVTGSAAGLTSASATGQDVGPIAEPLPPATNGTVSIVSGATLVATPAGWPAGTTFAYQWFRGGSAASATQAIAGATSPGYSPTAADSGKFLRVSLTATAPGRAPATVFSASKNYSVQSAGGNIQPQGRGLIGQTLTITNSLRYFDLSGPITPTRFTYQWLRNGAPIPGATGSTYTVTRSDWFSSITVRVTAVVPGRAPLTSLSTGYVFVYW